MTLILTLIILPTPPKRIKYLLHIEKTSWIFFLIVPVNHEQELVLLFKTHSRLGQDSSLGLQLYAPAL